MNKIPKIYLEETLTAYQIQDDRLFSPSVEDDGKILGIKNGELGLLSSGGGIYPELIITTSPGATIVVTHNGESISGIQEESIWTYILEDYGEYIVTASKTGETTKISEIEILENKVYSLKINLDHIYGVEWVNNSNPKFTRTDGAEYFDDPVPYVNDGIMTINDCYSPFDEIMPWSGMVEVEDPIYGTMIAIPKFWYKMTFSGNTFLGIQISNKPENGFQVSPAHMNRGTITDRSSYQAGERDVIYVGKYLINQTNHKSISGATPLTGITGATVNSDCQLDNNGYCMDFATLLTIQLLYLVEYANWNSQGCIGMGVSPGTVICGYSDIIPYHTGTTGNSKSALSGTKYRNIEGLWDNYFTIIAGCYRERIDTGKWWADYACVGLDIGGNPEQMQGGHYFEIGCTRGKVKTLVGVPKDQSGLFSFFWPRTAETVNYESYICDQVEWQAYVASGSTSVRYSFCSGADYDTTTPLHYGIFSSVLTNPRFVFSVNKAVARAIKIPPL